MKTDIINLNDFKSTSDTVEAFKQDMAKDLLIGLSASPKYISPKYFYDDEGSRIFQKIMNLDEYYLTNCETEILEKYSDDIASKLGEGPINILELGAGDGAKTKFIINACQKSQRDFTFYPLDISKEALVQISKNFESKFPDLKMKGIQADYESGVRWLSEQGQSKTLVLFLGSNIGNMDPDESKKFFHQLWSSLKDNDQVLLGIDLKKDISMLNAAYNDKEGVTRDFNLNLLEHLNREMGADFKKDKFTHYGPYDPVKGAMLSYLISTCEQTVHIGKLEKNFHFSPFEPIHVERSNKYLIQDIEQLATESGFQVEFKWHDKNKWFADLLLSVKKSKPIH